MIFLVNYIFDVDGTLTPSRSKMDERFAEVFSEFCEINNVYLVTGSDKPKTVEQIGETLYNKCKMVYQCSGSEAYNGATIHYRDPWQIPADAKKWLQNEVDTSHFGIRAGNHIEERTGMVNFSIVGINANQQERRDYIEYDNLISERDCIAERFNSEFIYLQATVAGETGLDISQRGLDKSQILRDFNPESNILFFGDSMGVNGNDWPLASALIKNYKYGASVHVKNWIDTFYYVQQFHNIV